MCSELFIVLIWVILVSTVSEKVVGGDDLGGAAHVSQSS